MNLVTEDNYYFLFLQLIDSNIDYIRNRQWLIVNPIRKDTYIEVLHDEHLDFKNLNVSVGSGLLPLTATGALRIGDIECTIDSSRGIRDNDTRAARLADTTCSMDSSRDYTLPIDSSLIYQPVKNYSLDLNFETLSTFSAIFPIYQDPNINFNQNLEYNNYKYFKIPFSYETPNNVISDITADLDIPVGLEGNNIAFYTDLGIDIDTTVGYALLPNYNNEKIENEYYTVWLLQDIPLGLLFINCFDTSDNLIYSLYCPSLEGGLFPGEVLGSSSTETSPLAIGLSISYCLEYNMYDLAMVQVRELLSFYSYSKLAGFPSSFKRVWNKSDIDNSERNLSINLVSFIFIITSLYSSSEKNYSNSILSEFNLYLESLIKLSVDLSPEDLTLEGFDKEGFSIYNFSLTNSFLLCVCISLYLSSNYSSEFHEKALKIKDKALSYFYNFVSYSDLTSLDDPYFFFAAHLFEELIDDEHFTGVFTSLRENLSLTSPDNIIDKSIYYYLNEKYNNYFSIDLEQILENLYGELGSSQASLYLTSIKGLLEKNFDPKTNFFDISSEELKVRKSLRHDKALLSFPISKEWYSEDEVEGSIKELLVAFTEPLSITDLFIQNNKTIFDINSKGKSLTNYAQTLSITRRVLEEDDLLRQRIRLKLLDSTNKQGFESWLTLFNEIHKSINRYNIIYNKIPEVYYKREELSKFSDLFGFPKEERFIRVNSFSLEDLYLESIKNVKVNGKPGVYVLDNNKRIIFKTWTDIFGTIYINIEDGFSPELFFNIKDNIPLGIQFKIVNNNIIYY